MPLLTLSYVPKIINEQFSTKYTYEMWISKLQDLVELFSFRVPILLIDFMPFSIINPIIFSPVIKVMHWESNPSELNSSIRLKPYMPTHVHLVSFTSAVISQPDYVLVFSTTTTLSLKRRTEDAEPPALSHRRHYPLKALRKFSKSYRDVS